jgi:alpha-galactosidase
MSRLRKTLVALVGSGALVTSSLVGITVASVTTAPSAAALDDGLAQTPPMGFNDWNSFGCNVSEDLIKSTADIFVKSGLKAAGYKYVNIDDCWMTHQRDPQTGRLVPDPVKFPDGIKGVADYVHSKGLKLGIYESAGSQTCAGYPGSLGHEKVDAQTFADWGVDYLKYDNCGDHGDYPDTTQGYIDRYGAMRDALEATGRPIVYSLCEWGVNQPWKWGASVGHLWRTTGDINDSWGSLKSIIRQNAPLSSYAGPGGWNDPDMLEVGNGGMTDTEYKTHFSLWSMMDAPLIIGTDLRKATPETMKILSNKDVIALDQDPLGKQAKLISDQDGTMVFAKPLANGDVAVALYNESDTAKTVSTTASDAGLPAAKTYRLDDLWSKDSYETAGTIAASVPAHGTVLYRVSTLGGGFDAYQPATLLTATGPADGVAEPGTTVPLQTTFTDNGKHMTRDVSVTADAPDGWTVEPTDAASAKHLATGESLTTHWRVGVPADARQGTYDIALMASYVWGEEPGSNGSTTTTVSVIVPPEPPSGATPLSDVTWVSETNGWGPPELDRSNGEQGAHDGNPITINGVVYPKGIGAHADSEITYYLGGRCSNLATDVGIDDEKTANGSVIFRILADGAVKAESPLMTPADDAVHLTADLSGARWLTIQEDSANGSNNSDHGDWAGPVLTCE